MAIETRIFATSTGLQSELRNVSIYGNSDLSVIRTREENKFYYNPSLSKSIKLLGDDYTWFKSIADGEHAFLDKFATFLFHILDDDKNKTYFIGNIDFFKINWDNEKRNLSFSVDYNDIYSIIAKNEDDRFNIWDVDTKYTIIAKSKSKVEYTTKNYQGLFTYIVSDFPNTATGHYRIIDYVQTGNEGLAITQNTDNPSEGFSVALYGREFCAILEQKEIDTNNWNEITDGYAKAYEYSFPNYKWFIRHNDPYNTLLSGLYFSGDTPPDSFVAADGYTYYLVSGIYEEYEYYANNVASAPVDGVKYRVYFYVNSHGQSTGVHNPIIEYEINYTNCIKLTDAFQRLIRKVSEQNIVTVESDFLENDLTELYLIDKYDLRRPNSSVKTSNYSVQHNDFMNDFYFFMKLGWIIENGKFKLEHENNLLNQQGFDLNSVESGKYIATDKNYQFDQEKLFNIEKITMNNVSHPDWLELDEKYNLPPINGRKNNSNEKILTYIETDIEALMSSNSINSLGSGVVLVKKDSNGYVEEYTGTFSEDTYQNVRLSLANMAETFLNYKKPVNQYTIRNSEYSKNITAQSYVRYKKQKEINFIYTQDIEYLKLIKTTLGWGEILKIEEMIYNNWKKVVLIYE